jgi:hypothetical protein
MESHPGAMEALLITMKAHKRDELTQSRIIWRLTLEPLRITLVVVAHFRAMEVLPGIIKTHPRAVLCIRIRTDPKLFAS